MVKEFVTRDDGTSGIFAEIRYPFLNRKDKWGNYAVDLVNLSKSQVSALKDLGLKVKFDADNEPESENYKGFYIKMKAQDAVEPTDTKGNPLPNRVMIGNGTKAFLTFFPRKWTHSESQRSGVSAKLLSCVIVELVRYDPDAAKQASAAQIVDGMDFEDGFVLEEDAVAGTETLEASSEDTDFDAIFNEQEAVA